MIDGWGEAENSRENLKSPVKVHYYPVGGISFRLCNSVNKYVVYHTHATELRQTLVNNRRADHRARSGRAVLDARPDQPDRRGVRHFHRRVLAPAPGDRADLGPPGGAR